jgi:hypothetical protein
MGERMTEYDNIFIQDKLFGINKALKTVQNEIYEIENFTDEFDSEGIKDNIEIIMNAIENINIELTQGEG